jgi:hypothetical protein
MACSVKCNLENLASTLLINSTSSSILASQLREMSLEPGYSCDNSSSSNGPLSLKDLPLSDRLKLEPHLKYLRSGQPSRRSQNFSSADEKFSSNMDMNGARSSINTENGSLAEIGYSRDTHGLSVVSESVKEMMANHVTSHNFPHAMDHSVTSGLRDGGSLTRSNNEDLGLDAVPDGGKETRLRRLRDSHLNRFAKQVKFEKELFLSGLPPNLRV